MIYHYKELNPTQIYKIMSQSVIPRPIAWIVTEDEGIVNVAPFSYFIPLSSNPATVIVSIGHKSDGSPKDTLANIRNNKKATICFVDEAHLEAMKQSATALPKEQSECKEYNIPTQTILKEYPPIIEDVQSAMFCDFFQEVTLGGSTIPLILEVKSQYFHEDVIDEELNISLDNIARVGKEFAFYGVR